jgi:hypothetical protein
MIGGLGAQNPNWQVVELTFLYRAFNNAIYL